MNSYLKFCSFDALKFQKFNQPEEKKGNFYNYFLLFRHNSKKLTIFAHAKMTI